jgi:hypothetical protein
MGCYRMARTVDLICSGEHSTPVVLAKAILPDDAPDPKPGNLCEDCAAAYTDGYRKGMSAGFIPTRAQVDKAMSDRKKSRVHPDK